jgi:hypothetical protein
MRQFMAAVVIIVLSVSLVSVGCSGKKGPARGTPMSPEEVKAKMAAGATTGAGTVKAPEPGKGAPPVPEAGKSGR